MPYVPRPATTAQCAHCNATFEKRHASRKYCSNSCNVQASYARTGYRGEPRATRAELEQTLAEMRQLIQSQLALKPTAKAATKPTKKVTTPAPPKPAAKAAATKPTKKITNPTPPKPAAKAANRPASKPTPRSPQEIKRSAERGRALITEIERELATPKKGKKRG